MKVKSVLFSEMRNKLGDQIVGTGWKGRMVFRAYKVPANPNTLKQQSERLHHKHVLELYQSNVGGDATKEGYWNTDALPRAISGYNLFMKLGRSSYIDCDATQTHPNDIDGHYFQNVDLSTGYVAVHKPDDTFEVIVLPGEMVAGEQPFALTNPGQNGTFLFFIADKRSKTYPPVLADQDGKVNCASPNPAFGNIIIASCVYSGVP
jgi:hypothetical protein